MKKALLIICGTCLTLRESSTICAPNAKRPSGMRSLSTCSIAFIVSSGTRDGAVKLSNQIRGMLSSNGSSIRQEKDENTIFWKNFCLWRNTKVTFVLILQRILRKDPLFLMSLSSRMCLVSRSYRVRQRRCRTQNNEKRK